MQEDHPRHYVPHGHATCFHGNANARLHTEKRRSEKRHQKVLARSEFKLLSALAKHTLLPQPTSANRFPNCNHFKGAVRTAKVSLSRFQWSGRQKRSALNGRTYYVTKLSVCDGQSWFACICMVNWMNGSASWDSFWSRLLGQRIAQTPPKQGLRNCTMFTLENAFSGGNMRASTNCGATSLHCAGTAKSAR